MMLPAVVLLGLFTLSSAQEDYSICGQNLDIRDDRIALQINTDSDPLGTWPWMASVGYEQVSEWKHLCGAVVITQKFVLTAAHCMAQDGLLIRLGDKNLKSASDDSEANTREIEETIFHPKYNIHLENAYYDIALLKVKRLIAYSSYIRPICLPDLTFDLDQYAGDHVTVTGWGFSSRNSPDGGDILRAVPIKIFPQRICNQTHSDEVSGAYEFEISKHLPQLFTPNILCAGYERPLYGPCKGDSGSPLVRYQFEPPQYVLLGLVQGGIGACGDKDFPAIFTRIDAEEIHRFIMGEIGIASRLHDGSLDIAEDGNSPLIEYSKKNQFDDVRRLLEQGANLSHVNNEGQNALMLASSANGTLRLSNFLLSRGIDIHQQDNEGRNALHYAAQSGNLAVLKRLMSKGLQVNSRDNDHKTPLHLAVRYGKYGTVKHLLQKGADISARSKKYQTQAIHFSAYEREGASVIQLLLDEGAEFESKDVFQATTMFRTFIYGHLGTTKQLYELGAQVDVVNNKKRSVLYKAAQLGNVNHIRWLSQINGGDLMKRLLDYPDSYGDTPLLISALRDQYESVRELLSQRADVQHVNKRGLNALIAATLSNDTLGIIELLISNGISLRHEDSAGRNALHFAAKSGNLPALHSLLRSGVPIDSGDRNKATPLIYAAKAGKYGTVRYLLQVGADKAIRDESGRNALDWAERYSYETVAELLE